MSWDSHDQLLRMVESISPEEWERIRQLSLDNMQRTADDIRRNSEAASIEKLIRVCGKLFSSAKRPEFDAMEIRRLPDGSQSKMFFYLKGRPHVPSDTEWQNARVVMWLSDRKYIPYCGLRDSPYNRWVSASWYGVQGRLTRRRCAGEIVRILEGTLEKEFSNGSKTGD